MPPKMNQIGRYRLDSKLGEGASGVVYRAYDPLMDREVAIKSVKPQSMYPEANRTSRPGFSP